MVRIAFATVALALCFASPIVAEPNEALKVITDAGGFLEPYSGDTEEAQPVDAGVDEAVCDAFEKAWQLAAEAQCLDDHHKDDKVVCVFGSSDCSMDDICHFKNNCGYLTDETKGFIKVSGYTCSASTGSQFSGNVDCHGSLTGLSIALIVGAVLVFLLCCCGCIWCVCKKCC